MPRVCVFDVNETLLDLQPLKESIGRLLGGGPEAARLWFTTLLQYSLVTTLADHYADFAEIGAACLRMVAKNHGVELAQEVAKQTQLSRLPTAVDTLEGNESSRHRSSLSDEMQSDEMHARV